MSDWLHAAKPLTVETLRRAIEEVRTAPVYLCGTTEAHVVHPRAQGWTSCANCFGPVFIEDPPGG